MTLITSIIQYYMHRCVQIYTYIVKYTEQIYNSAVKL